jgi:hypothetical protein
MNRANKTARRRPIVSSSSLDDDDCTAGTTVPAIKTLKDILKDKSPSTNFPVVQQPTESQQQVDIDSLDLLLKTLSSGSRGPAGKDSECKCELEVAKYFKKRDIKKEILDQVSPDLDTLKQDVSNSVQQVIDGIPVPKDGKDAVCECAQHVAEYFEKNDVEAKLLEKVSRTIAQQLSTERASLLQDFLNLKAEWDVKMKDYKKELLDAANELNSIHAKAVDDVKASLEAHKGSLDEHLKAKVAISRGPRGVKGASIELKDYGVSKITRTDDTWTLETTDGKKFKIETLAI